MVIRDICWLEDKEQLVNLNAAFSTEYIYRVALNGISAEIPEEKLDAPFEKKYPLDDVESEIKNATFTVAVEIDNVIVGFATAKYEDWNRRVNLTGVYVLPDRKGQGIGTVLISRVWDYTKTTPGRCLWLDTQNANFQSIQVYVRSWFEFFGFDVTLHDNTQGSLSGVALYFRRIRHFDRCIQPEEALQRDAERKHKREEERIALQGVVERIHALKSLLPVPLKVVSVSYTVDMVDYWLERHEREPNGQALFWALNALRQRMFSGILGSDARGGRRTAKYLVC